MSREEKILGKERGRTVEAIAAGTLNITFIIEFRFKIIKIVARRFAKKLERYKKTSVRTALRGGDGNENARNEEVDEAVRPHHMGQTTLAKHFGYWCVCVKLSEFVGIQQ
jgi:hypothetical protein